jgi:hypothetical protein
MSQFVILIYDIEARWAEATPETFAEVMDKHNQFGEGNDDVLGGKALEPTATATTVRPDGQGGFTVTDGPFAETKEALGGYYLVEAPDLDAAIEMAKRVPVLEGCLEVRPVMVFE